MAGRLEAARASGTIRSEGARHEYSQEELRSRDVVRHALLMITERIPPSRSRSPSPGLLSTLRRHHMRRRFFLLSCLVLSPCPTIHGVIG